MGFVQRRWRPPTWLLTAVFVPATLGCVALGTVPALSTLLLFDRTTWQVAILAYCFVASLLPVSWLLQPRGYLGGFVLYIALAVGVVGIFFGGHGEIRQPAFADPGDGLGASLFPFLFVTIACGACSGFHGLVCGGTTSKQIDEGESLPPGRLRRDAARGVRRADRARDRDDPLARARRRGRPRASSTATGSPPSRRRSSAPTRCASRGSSARWRSRPSSSTRSTSPRGSAATSSRSCSAAKGAVAGGRRDARDRGRPAGGAAAGRRCGRLEVLGAVRLGEPAPRGAHAALVRGLARPLGPPRPVRR